MADDTRRPETRSSPTPCNKGMLTGPKPRLNVCEIYPIPIRLQPASEEHDDLALFNHDIDSKLRGSRSNNERQRGSCYIVKRSLL